MTVKPNNISKIPTLAIVSDELYVLPLYNRIILHVLR